MEKKGDHGLPQTAARSCENTGMSKQQRPDALACRRNKVGGEAVLEGVMMKAGERYCVATRTEDGAIRLKENRFESVRKRHKALNIPVLRGIVNFVEVLLSAGVSGRELAVF